MGIVIDDPLLNGHCPLCFPAGETPEFLLASFSGIKTGDLWVAGMPPPPNKTFKMSHFLQDCEWKFEDAKHRCIYFCDALGSGIGLTTALPIVFFFGGQDVNPCVWSFGAIATQPPPKIYYGGSCAISWVPPVLSTSLATIADSVGLEADDTIRADFWPNDNDVITRFVDHKTNSRIRIFRET